MLPMLLVAHILMLHLQARFHMQPSISSHPMASNRIRLDDTAVHGMWSCRFGLHYVISHHWTSGLPVCTDVVPKCLPVTCQGPQPLM